MRQRLLIHIGLHKTGTTFYQRSVWPNWKGVAYAGKPRPRGATSLQAVIAGMSDPLILLSDETLSGSLKRAYLQGRTWPELQSAALEQVRDRYARHYELSVLVSLRRHDRWILSIYKHYLKYGGVETLEDFLGLGAHAATLPPEHLSYRDRITRVEETLGTRPFCFFLEETRHHPELLSKQLAAFAGVEEGPDFSGGERYNEGVNRREAALCRTVNRVLLNPFRVGKASLRRNGTSGHAIARLIGERGLLGRNSQGLELPPRAAEFLRKRFEDDLAGSVAYLCHGRGLQPDNFRDALDLTL
jgi:hypothetical protein